MRENGPRIVATEFSCEYNAWLYKLNDGRIVRGESGDARVPCGLAWTERNQWGANQVFGAQR